MKKLILLLFIQITLIKLNAQVKIGAPGNPDVNAVLELAGTTKGLLLPRLALTGTASAAPLSAHTAGMVIYNTATVADVTPGYFYNDGTRWSRIAYSSETWGLTGNSATNPASQFLGTRDATDFKIRTNNLERIRIGSAGDFDIGTNTLPANMRIRIGGTSTGNLAATMGFNGTINATANGQHLVSIYNSPSFGTGFTHSTITGLNTAIAFSGTVNGAITGNDALVTTIGSSNPNGNVVGIRGQVARNSTGAGDGNFYGGYFHAETGSPGSGTLSEMFGTQSSASLNGTDAATLLSLGAQNNLVLTFNPNAVTNQVYGINNNINHGAGSTLNSVNAISNNVIARLNSIFNNAYGTISTFATYSGGGIINCYGHYVNGIDATANISNFRGIYIGNIGLTAGTRRVFEYDGTGTNDPVIINYDGSVQIGNTTPVTNAKLSITDGHLQSGQVTKPLIVANANMGTGATASLNDATDIAGIINLDFGSSPYASGVQSTITFNKTYANAPIVIITPASLGAALGFESQRPYVTSTTTGFTIHFGLAATSGNLMIFNYHVIETTNN